LVRHPKPGETVDLVTPQIEAHRRIRSGREDVDDRSASRDLAAVFHERFTPIPLGDEMGEYDLGIEDLTLANHDRLDGLSAGGEMLQQGSDPSHDHRRTALGIAHPPQHLETPSHCLHSGRHPFKGQGLPSGIENDLVGWEELAEVVDELCCGGARGYRHDKRSPRGDLRHRCKSDRASWF
jgi:hypothetical protein